MKNTLILSLLLIIALLAITHQRGAQSVIEDTTLLHHADFPLCVTVKPSPLLRDPDDPLAPDKPPNDRGEA